MRFIDDYDGVHDHHDDDVYDYDANSLSQGGREMNAAMYNNTCMELSPSTAADC
jgi:hypothetical protein